MSGNIREIPKTDGEVGEVLDQVKAMAKDIDCLMIVAIDSKGAQHLWTSNTSGYKKAFMLQFLQAWMVKWFNIGSV